MTALFLSIALLAAEPAGQAPASQAPATAPPQECRNTTPSPDKDEIVVCAEKQEGYRINTDVLEASRGAKRRGQRPKIVDHTTRAPTLCEHIGGCRALEQIDLIGTALTAAQLAARAAQGESVGSILRTRPEMSEYELYLEAKRQREAKEAEVVAAERAAAETAAKKASKVDRD